MAQTQRKAAARRSVSRPRARAAAAPRTVPSRRVAAAERAFGDRVVREIGALALVAAAVFCAFVLYFAWGGGPFGRAVVALLELTVGLLAYVVPAVLVYAAVLLAAGKEKRPTRALSIGVIVLLLAFALAAAGDAFGLFGGSRPVPTFDGAYVRTHGGAVGELLWVVVKGVAGSLGVNVLAVTALVAGVLLVSGSSLGLWAGRSARGARAAGRAARRSAHTLSERRALADDFRGRATPHPSGLPPDQEVTLPADGRGLHLIDGERELPDIYSAVSAVTVAEAAAPAGAAADDEPLAGDAGRQLSLADEPQAEADPAVRLAFNADARRQWQLPDPALMHRMSGGEGEVPATIDRVSSLLVETLGHFGVAARVVEHVSGPRVTRYELQLSPGTKVSRVSSLKDDIAYALAATDIRILAPIPGKTAVGVEVPNTQPNWVGLGDIYGDFPVNASPLAFWVGKDIGGKSVLADLTRMVHVLIAGTTGSGKSACINALISSILLRATPDDVRLILIDPKKVELSNFDGVPHLLAPVVTNMKNANHVLANMLVEMDARYALLQETGNAQHLRDLNRKRVRAGETPLPYIVLVIDELADLMLVAPNDVETAITRLGQLGRAVGIHLVVATQRPSVDVITGLIKANIPSRIAFAVSSQIDSRVILDAPGAESLLGDGDMLFHPFTSSRVLRVQGAFVSPEEMKLINAHWRAQSGPEFREDLLAPPASEMGDVGPTGGDELLPRAIETVVHTGAASVALLQRRLRVGYARAGRLVDIMEEMGIVSGFEGSKARRVLIDEVDLPRYVGGHERDDAAAAVVEPSAVEPDEPVGTDREPAGDPAEPRHEDVFGLDGLD